MISLLKILLTLSVLGFSYYWFKHWRDSKAPSRGVLHFFTGVVTDFLDTLGIGSFATTTTAFRSTRSVPDELIPGTMNVGHTLPTFLQAMLFFESVAVDPVTLVSMIGASVAGAWFGSGIVVRLPRRRVQLGMAVALSVAAVVLLRKATDSSVEAGTDLGIHGPMLAAGIAGNFILGALMTLGIGLYAPCMVLVFMLGMQAKAAFPIMMGSCAFLMPVASARFIKSGAYSPRAALGLTLGGLPGVYLAWRWFQGLDIHALFWVITAVVVFAAASLFRTALK